MLARQRSDSTSSLVPLSARKRRQIRKAPWKMGSLSFERAEIVYAAYHCLKPLLIAFHETLGEDGPSQKGIVKEVGKARNGDLAGGRILPSMMF